MSDLRQQIIGVAQDWLERPGVTTEQLADAILSIVRVSPAEEAVVERFEAAPVPADVVDAVVQRIASQYRDAAGARFAINDFRDWLDDHPVTALPPSPAEEAVKRVEALADTWEARARAYAAADDRDKVTDLRQRAAALRAALASPAPAPQEWDEHRGWV